MRFSKTTLIGAVPVVAALVGLGWYIVRDLRPGPAADDNAATGSSTTRTIGGITFEGEGDIVVEQVPVGEVGPAPSLDRPINIPATFSAEAASLMRAEVARLVAGIKTDPGNTELWLALGLRRQEIADYAGARQAYEYVSRLAPKSSTAYSNLGNLYHYYLKDFAKSEQYYLQAIKLDPKLIVLYINLHDLYRYSYKQSTNAAADILIAGIKENPDAVDLYIALGAHYKTQGNRKEARSYYNQALDLAVELGNTALREAIGKALSEI